EVLVGPTVHVICENETTIAAPPVGQALFRRRKDPRAQSVQAGLVEVDVPDQRSPAATALAPRRYPTPGYQGRHVRGRASRLVREFLRRSARTAASPAGKSGPDSGTSRGAGADPPKNPLVSPVLVVKPAMCAANKTFPSVAPPVDWVSKLNPERPVLVSWK